MTLVTSIESLFAAMEVAGFIKTSKKNGFRFDLVESLGRGYIEISGDIAEYYFIEADYRLNKELRMQLKLDEKFLEISYLENDFDVNYESEEGIESAPQGLNCHINIKPVVFTLNLSKGQPIQYKDFVIRERFLKQNIPEFYTDFLDRAAVFYDKGLLREPQITSILRNMMLRKDSSFSNRLYINGKVLEAISLLVKHIESEPETGMRVLSDYDLTTLNKARDIIDNSWRSPLSLKKLARAVGTNTRKLKEGFKQLYGITVFAYIRDIRMNRAAEYLRDSSDTIERISELVGYSSAAHFYKNFRKEFGMTPSKFRRSQRR